MAYYDYQSGLDFDAQEQEMLQAAARIKALRGMKTDVDIDQPQGFQSAVTGAKFLAPTVKKPLLNSLSPLLQDYTANQMESELSRQRGSVNQAQQKFADEWYGGAPQAKTETVRTPLGPTEPTGSFEGDPAKIIEGINNIADPTERARALQGYRNQIEAPGGYREKTVTTPPTREAVLAHGAKGLQGGALTRTMAQQYLADQLIKEPEREEARAARKEERQSALAATLQKQKDEQAFRQSIVGQQLASHEAMAQQQRASHESIAQQNREAANERAREAAADRAAAKEDKAAEDKPNKYQLITDPITGNTTRVNKLTNEVTQVGPTKSAAQQKNLPAAEQGKYSANKATMDSIDSILGDKKNRDATGFVKGTLAKIPVVGTKIVDAWGTMGEQARRNEINRLSAIEVHRLYGASQTLGEIARAGGFMPLPTDNAEQIDSKMKQMKASIARENKAIDDMAASQDYKSPSGKSPKGNTDEDDALVNKYLKK